ncbi:MAG: HEAT repeat domain-containing protein [Cyanobacteria bacterium P01_A01_bin.114]
MNIREIEDALSNKDFQYRLKAIVALRDYDADTAVPLLMNTRKDPEFLVRSFVAMGLGKKRNDDSFAALLEMMQCDRDANVQAEAANSLAKFGQAAVPHLVRTFHKNKNWLVRRSILAVMPDLDAPDALLEICLESLKDEDRTVIEAAIDTLGTLAHTAQQATALQTLLDFVQDPAWNIRMHVAYALKPFDAPDAKQALQAFRQDTHHRVVAAALEELLPE